MEDQVAAPNKDQELIATVGLPGSGKTTWTLGMLGTGQFTRVNSDDLRSQRPKAREPFIRRLRDEAIQEALRSGSSVIVDNTNLHSVSDLRRMAHAHGAQFRIQDFRDVPWQECVRRDAERAARGERATGRSVIIRMAMDYGLFELDSSINKEAIIIDLDGTLSDTSERVHHLRKPKPDWNAFFEGIPHDSANRAVGALYHMALTSSYTVLFLTGRPENYRRPTESWLHRHGFGDYFALFMRGSDSQQPDYDVKAHLYDRYVAPYFDVRFTVDDRPKVVAMWRAKGLVCFSVGSDEE